MSLVISLSISNMSDDLKLPFADISHFSVINFKKNCDVQIFTKGVTDGFNEEDLVRFLAAMFDSRPDLVTWNGRGFILPLLELKLLKYGIPHKYLVDCHSPDRKWSNYHSRYSREHLDLCDLLSNYGAAPKMSLQEVSEVLNLPTLESYSESDDLNTQRVKCIAHNVNTFLIYLKRLYIEESITAEQYDLAFNNLTTLKLVSL